MSREGNEVRQHEIVLIGTASALRGVEVALDAGRATYQKTSRDASGLWRLFGELSYHAVTRN